MPLDSTGSGRGNHLGTELALSQSRIERAGLKPGTRAPLFTLPDLEGSTVSLDDYRGTDVLLVFSDPKCGPCQALAPNLVRLSAKNPQLQVLMVSRGDLQENRAKAHANAFPFPVVLQDGWKLSKEYGMFATPIAFLIDKRGVIATPVAVGAEQILRLIPEGRRIIMPRWKAIGQLAAAFAGGLFAVPLRVFAQGSCPSGQTLCNGTCVNIATDPNNCGACGSKCASGQSCQAGVCFKESCPSGQTLCDGTCVNTATDPNNCGACGSKCASGQSCQAGVCFKESCPSGQILCNGTCVNTNTDPNNCGACGNTCASGQSCQAGACAQGCPSGQALCNGTCVNTNTDPDNCGKCGNTCASGELCQSGVCVCSPTILSDGAPEVITSGTVAFVASVATCGTSGNLCFYFGIAASNLSESVCKPVNSQTGPQSVWVPATGFSSKTTYYYQARLGTTAGAASGTIQSFTTF
jgi:peroxiredoxin